MGTLFCYLLLAFCLTPALSASTTVTLDNLAPEVTAQGIWTTATASSAKFGSNYFTDANAGKGTKVATICFNSVGAQAATAQ